MFVRNVSHSPDPPMFPMLAEKSINLVITTYTVAALLYTVPQVNERDFDIGISD